MSPRRRLPGPLKIAIAVVGGQAGVLIVLAGLEIASFSSDRVSLGASTTVFFLLFAAFLGVSAWGLSRASSWARSPAILAQLIALGLAWNFRGGEFASISVALSIVAVLALVGVLAPSSTRALEGIPDPAEHSGPRDEAA